MTLSAMARAVETAIQLNSYHAYMVYNNAVNGLILWLVWGLQKLLFFSSK